MIYLDLLLGFLYVGCFAFGGAYGAIPLIRDVVLSHGWVSDETFTYVIAVSESTPGPIMINLATYVGKEQAGFIGAVIATTAVVLPSFIVILLAMAVLKTLVKNKYFQAVLRGLKPCIIGIILATGISMIFKNALPLSEGRSMDLRGLLITLLLFAAKYGMKRWKKKELSPIWLIVVSACMGIFIYGFFAPIQ